MPRPTIQDLAQKSGVSVSTVDRVLNGRNPVRPATAQRVLDAAEAIGFYATGLLRQRLRTDVPERRLGFLLQQRSTSFYRNLGEALVRATNEASVIRGRALVEFMEDLTPGAVARRIAQMGRSADALAVVAADHPNVTQAIDQVRARGVPVFALISDLTAEARRGYIGLDNRKVGRTAAWLIAHLSERAGKVAILVGSHRYLCQETCEISFRAYLREQAPGFRLLEPVATFESELYAYEATLDLLRRHGDLAGLYVAGGGIEGVLRALNEGPGERHLITIAHDLTEETRAGLVAGRLAAVLSHPLDQIARRAVDLMAAATIPGMGGDHFAAGIVPLEIYLPENV